MLNLILCFLSQFTKINSIKYCYFWRFAKINSTKCFRIPICKDEFRKIFSTLLSFFNNWIDRMDALRWHAKLKSTFTTAWKVSVLRVVLVVIFPYSDWIRTRKTPNTDTLTAVICVFNSKTTLKICQKQLSILKTEFPKIHNNLYMI